MVMVTASGVFSEMQTGLNQAWQVKAPDQPVLLMLRARAASLGLVAALGFLLMVSLAASAAISALGTYLGGCTSFAPPNRAERCARAARSSKALRATPASGWRTSAPNAATAA